MKFAWLYYNHIRDRWLKAETHEELTYANLYILPEGSDPEGGYEPRRGKNGLPYYPMYEGKRLQRGDSRR